MPIQYSPQDAAELFPSSGWFKAEKSGGGNGGEGCVEVNLAKQDDGMIGLRDNKLANSPTFVFDRHEWACFLDGAKNGEFDLNA